VLLGYCRARSTSNRLCHLKRSVSDSNPCFPKTNSNISCSLCLAVIIALPAATPSEFKNTAAFALGDFENRKIPRYFPSEHNSSKIVNGWPSGYAFILSFLAPLWTICKAASLTLNESPANSLELGSFDSSVHISEEASNAATAVPWAIVWAISIAGVLGWGVYTQLASSADTNDSRISH
jgi:amino acid transporter